MLNFSQNILLPQGSPKGDGLSQGQVGAQGANSDGVNGLSAEEVFSMVLSGAFDEQMLEIDSASVVDTQGDGEGLNSLAELGLSLEDLQSMIPSELLAQFVQSGGQDVAGLQQFIQEQTGLSLDLAENLPANLNDALVLLNKQGVDTKPLVASIDGEQLDGDSLKIIKQVMNGQFQDQFGQQLNQVKQQQLGSMADGELIDTEAGKALIDDVKAFFMKDEQMHLDPQKGKLFTNQLLNASQQPFIGAGELNPATQSAGIIANPFAPHTPINQDTPMILRPMQVAVPVGQGQWESDFNDQVMWLSNQQLKSASIKLNPAELGPVEINIRMINETATVHFNSHSGQVRELIEQAVPRLREMMSDNGVQLSDVNVSDNGAQQQQQRRNDFNLGGQGQEQNGYGKDGNDADEQESQEVMVSQVVHKKPQGLVDYFA